MSPTAELAQMARAGLHDLQPYWTPDDGWVNPLDDPEVQREVRKYIGNRWLILQAERAAERAAMNYRECDDTAYQSDVPV